MVNLDIDFNIREKILKFLSKIINPKDVISYYKKNSILRKIRNFLLQIDGFQRLDESKLEVIMEKISFAVSIILKRIKLKGQFVARMDLVANGRLKSEDIAKLTSLRGKSHYDVLRERMFLQNKPKWFFRNYPKEIKALENEFQIIYEKVIERRRRLNSNF